MHHHAKTPAPLTLALMIALLVSLMLPAQAQAGRMGWLDDVLRQIVADAKGTLHEGGQVKVGRLFSARTADRGIEELVGRSADLTRVAARTPEPAAALLDARFGRMIGDDATRAAFHDLKPAEKRLVIEMGETAANLVKKHPGEAEGMIRKLGPDGLMAVRAFGDDVAGTLVQEGPECLSVLRKTGRGGWDFFTGSVLPHKKKLAAAGVMAAFLANPDRFVDYAGRATEYAVREFAKAGVSLAGATASGLENAFGQALASQGLNAPIFRKIAMAATGLVAALALLAFLGARPLAWLTRLGQRRF